MGKTQLMSVPYALYAKQAGSTEGDASRVDPDDWTLGGNSPPSHEASVLGTTNGKNLSIITNSTERLFIKGSNGKIGIGTSDPQEKLHISGKICANAFFIKPEKYARILRNEELGNPNYQSLYLQNKYQGVTITVGGLSDASNPVDPADLKLQ